MALILINAINYSSLKELKSMKANKPKIMPKTISISPNKTKRPAIFAEIGKIGYKILTNNAKTKIAPNNWAKRFKTGTLTNDATTNNPEKMMEAFMLRTTIIQPVTPKSMPVVQAKTKPKKIKNGNNAIEMTSKIFLTLFDNLSPKTTPTIPIPIK